MCMHNMQTKLMCCNPIVQDIIPKAFFLFIKNKCANLSNTEVLGGCIFDNNQEGECNKIGSQRQTMQRGRGSLVKSSSAQSVVNHRAGPKDDEIHTNNG